MHDKKKEINYWPYTIVGMILTVVMLSVWTIKVTIKNPVQLENSYMMKYQDVDDKINEILEKQKAFDSRYRVVFDKNRFSAGPNRINITILDKNGTIVKKAEVTALVTRPDSTLFDKKLKRFDLVNGTYRSEEFVLKKRGRWNFVVKIEIGDDVGFKTYKTFIK